MNSYAFPTGWFSEQDQLCFSIGAGASPGQEIVVEQAIRAWSKSGDVTRWFEINDRGFLVGGCNPGPGTFRNLGLRPSMSSMRSP
ncbi:MAG: hypothetical protein ACI9TF_000405 [Paracrocinitomix sp.]|jgi:hypothetical protein